MPTFSNQPDARMCATALVLQGDLSRLGKLQAVKILSEGRRDILGMPPSK